MEDRELERILENAEQHYKLALEISKEEDIRNNYHIVGEGVYWKMFSKAFLNIGLALYEQNKVIIGVLKKIK